MNSMNSMNNTNNTNTIKFITLTNTGYIKYTLNCLRSLENIKYNRKLHCYCIGTDGYEVLKFNGYDCTLIDNENNSNFQTFRTGNWSNITYNKFKIIHENLLTNDYICITDRDIVYENIEFEKYLLENIGDNDLLIQNDSLEDDGDNLCSGFMFIRSNSNTLSLFNPMNVENNKNIEGWDDQVYINNIKNNLKYKKLPLNLFPTGLYYYNNYLNINPYIIHFNFIIGHEKNV